MWNHHFGQVSWEWPLYADRSIPMYQTQTLIINAIGGVRVKKSMLALFERSPWGGEEAFYGMSKLIFVQKLSHFEVRDFGRISYKKTDKIDILRYFTPNLSSTFNICRNELKFAPDDQTIWGNKIKEAFLCQFCPKNSYYVKIMHF